MSANMETIILAYFNGTPQNFPYKCTPQKIFECLDENISSYDDDVEFYYNQTAEMEKALNDNSKRGFVTEKRLQKTAKDLGFESSEGFAIIWFCNIHYLLKKGRICDDNNFGFMTMSGNGVISAFQKVFDEQLANSALCGVCKVKSKLKCGKCHQMYCCREHQVQDWKNHKKVCGK